MAKKKQPTPIVHRLVCPRCATGDVVLIAGVYRCRVPPLGSSATPLGCGFSAPLQDGGPTLALLARGKRIP